MSESAVLLSVLLNRPGIPCHSQETASIPLLSLGITHALLNHSVTLAVMDKKYLEKSSFIEHR